MMLRPRLEAMQRSSAEFEMLPGRLEVKCAQDSPQTEGYRERRAADAAWLVMFVRSVKPKRRRGFRRIKECAGGPIETWGAWSSELPP